MSKERLQERYVPYYARWVAECYRYYNLLEKGHGIRTIQELLGHSNLQTTMIYTHVARKNILGVGSPLDG